MEGKRVPPRAADQAEPDSLLEGDELYHSLAELMPQIVWTADAEGSFDYYNRRWYEYTGQTPEQTLGWGWQPILHPDDAERCLRRWARSVKTGEDYEIEYRFRRASDGNYRWHLGRAVPVRNSSGQILKWIGTSTDIHDHKLVAEEREELLAREQVARHQAELMSARLESVQIITQAALAHLSINDLLDEVLTRIREILSVDTVAILLVEEAEGELYAWAAKGLEEEVEQGVRLPIGRGFAGGIIAKRAPTIIFDLEHADVLNPLLREKGLKSMLGVPLMIEGRAIGVIHVGTLHSRRFTGDDTSLLQLIADRLALAIDHARLYEVEQAARAEAEAANRAKDEFLATVSHELRTPLTPIIGWVHMLQSGTLSPREVERGLTIIGKNSYALTRLINDLLDMSAILSGKMLIENAVVPVDDAVEEAVETVRMEAALRGIEIEFMPCDKGTMMVSGDRTRLIQVFWNLLHNAVKFSDSKSRVQVRCEADEEEVRVHIEDRGIGISEDFLPLVFERFRQADGSKTRLHGGLGLGLSLVKSFVEAHGGSVSATSPGHGHGSHFTVHLPRLAEDGLSVRRIPQDDLKAAPAGERVRLLVIEDSSDTLDMLQVVFEMSGYEATLCQTPTEALRVGASMWFDMIISDIGMPEIDGYELLARLREIKHLRDVPAVALTGYASHADAEQARRAGFQAHIAKPVDPTELATKIEELLHQGRRRSEQ
ncbi:MAG TPA: ATP-binding protein [Pyrinomonadaceae bacterium]|nr:ATP-binding protein [Pyrinomonadaceae bacterium]